MLQEVRNVANQLWLTARDPLGLLRVPSNNHRIICERRVGGAPRRANLGLALPVRRPCFGPTYLLYQEVTTSCLTFLPGNYCFSPIYTLHLSSISVASCTASPVDVLYCLYAIDLRATTNDCVKYSACVRPTDWLGRRSTRRHSSASTKRPGHILDRLPWVDLDIALRPSRIVH